LKKTLRGTLFLLAVFVCSANLTLAVSLSEYHQRVRNAINALDQLKEAEESDSGPVPADIAANLRAARSALPESETVDWSGAIITVDNSWLERDLSEYEHAAAYSSARKQPLLRALERLAALEARLDEAEKAPSEVGKADLKERLAAILSRPDYARAEQGQSALARLLERFVKWLRSLFPQRDPISPGRAQAVSRGVQIFVILLALAAIAFVLKNFLPRLLDDLKRKQKTKAEARIVLGERLEPDQSSADLLAEAERLARAGNLREAIRKGYIALLVELGDRNIISLAQYKTNHDYLRAVRDVRALYPSMQALTNSFDLHWYGARNTTEQDWLNFRAGYSQALQS